MFSQKLNKTRSTGQSHDDGVKLNSLNHYYGKISNMVAIIL